MSRGLLFWIIMILCILGGVYIHRDGVAIYIGNQFVNWVLFALLGWKVFGPILKE